VARIPAGVGPKDPHIVVLFGATGDLSKRKLLPGLFHLSSTGFIPGCRIIGISLEDTTSAALREIALESLKAHAHRQFTEDAWNAFAANLEYVPLEAGASALKEAVDRAEKSFGGGTARRLHYLSVPPSAALPAVRMLGEAGLVDRARIVMEKPFGVDLQSAVSLNTHLHEVFDESQIFRIDHVQIDVPEKLDLGKRVGFYEATGAYRDMVVTHLFQILAFTAMEPPTALEPASISEEKNKVFRSLLPLRPSDVVRGQYMGYREEEGVDPASDTETFIALKCSIDNWRWAGVPFYLRTGKRPGPGMRLDKCSLQFNMHDTGHVGDVLEAYERLILDAMRGDHTLFTTAEGIERLWQASTPLLDAPLPVRPYAPGSWGPNAIHQLIAPHAWRLPFERAWRDPNVAGA